MGFPSIRFVVTCGNYISLHWLKKGQWIKVLIISIEFVSYSTDGGSSHSCTMITAKSLKLVSPKLVR